MAQVIRFFHVRHANASKGGATVRVVGEDNELAVRVQIAYCSPKDQFCRKTGREQAEKSSTIAIPLKGLPGLLHKVSKKVLRKTHWNPNKDAWFDDRMMRMPHPGWRQKTDLWNRDWAFSTKYWTPKEVKQEDQNNVREFVFSG